MPEHSIDAARRAYLRSKYIDDAPPGPVAAAEQLAKAMQEVRTAAEDWNAEQGCGWLNWQTAPALGERIERHLARVREAEARQSRGGGTYVNYFDDRNSFDEANGWPAYDPDNPGHANVVRGHILAEHMSGRPITVHILRGGTEPGLFAGRERDRPADEGAPATDDLPNYGHPYDFVTFMAHADVKRILRFCDVSLPNGCGTGIGGGPTTLVALPVGRDLFAAHICPECLRVAELEITPGGYEPAPPDDHWEE